MKITEFYFRLLVPGGWEIGPIKLKRTNLFVGVSGTGKTRTLNSIFNVGCMVARNSQLSQPYECISSFENKEKKYEWKISASHDDNGKNQITHESLSLISGDESVDIIKRDGDVFVFNGAALPKLDKSSSALHLLKDEESVKSAYEVFTKIMRRRFQSDALEQQMGVQNIPKEIESKFSKSKDLSDIPVDFTVNGKLYLLDKYKREKIDEIEKHFKSVFPKVKGFKIKLVESPLKNKDADPVPMLFMTEENVNDDIPCSELSSGMQKVLAIIIDILTIPEDMIYLIDEYENSLGVNAIDFLPPLLSDYTDDKQIIITTHHPYLINKIPVSNWVVFNRSGSKVTIKSGDELKERYGKSKQKAFVQLTNDPSYTDV